ncbi:MAG: hypothetical protein LBD74_07410 [Spirochaetaceae bacterium]|jgi:hypothetical protein|nr:hypothetical protein [Spirochaetaceae bacterium]
MKRKILPMSISLALVLMLGFSGCNYRLEDDDDDGDSNRNTSADGSGYIVINDMASGFRNGQIFYKTVSGGHKDDEEHIRFRGGERNGEDAFDRTGYVTITDTGVVNIPVEGYTGDGYGFKNGTYFVSFTVINASSYYYNKTYTISVEFYGSSGQGSASKLKPLNPAEY